MRRIGIFSAFLAGFIVLAAHSGAVYSGTMTARLTSPKADRVVVLKTARKLVLMQQDRVLRIYRVALGRYPLGHKQQEGDARTPEGAYMLDFKLRDSDFYKAIHVSYPNETDISYARARGVDAGGKIMIHGLPNKVRATRVGHPMIDWTQGCIAVTNREMDEIWRMVDAGTPIEIRP
jgi:murein L,D-transpeptidase YafK